MSARQVRPWLLVAPATALLAWGGNAVIALVCLACCLTAGWNLRA